jgi:hypothetical protein
MYDGSPDQFIPFLNRLDLRSQDERWINITYVSQNGIAHDILTQFTVISHETVLTDAK